MSCEIAKTLEAIHDQIHAFHEEAQRAGFAYGDVDELRGRMVNALDPVMREARGDLACVALYELLCMCCDEVAARLAAKARVQ